MTFGPSILNAFPYVIRPWHLTFQVVLAPRCCEFATPSRSGWTHSQNRICNCLGFLFPNIQDDPLNLPLLAGKTEKSWRFWNRKTASTKEIYLCCVDPGAKCESDNEFRWDGRDSNFIFLSRRKMETKPFKGHNLDLEHQKTCWKFGRIFQWCLFGETWSTES